MTSGIPKRLVRIFVSSTFLEFKRERDELAGVFKDLQELCESKGFSFHPIDLRWGVSCEDSEKNIAVKVCLDEIKRCKELSPDINFFIMAGECYGWQPLPETIKNDVWNRLTRGVDAESDQIHLLNLYYQQDTNNLEVPYCLMPRSHIDQYVDRNIADETVRKALLAMLDEKKAFCEDPDRAGWDRQRETLQWQYSASATEQEITCGYFQEKQKSKYNTFILLKGNQKRDVDGTSQENDPAGQLKKRLMDEAASTRRLQVYEKKSEDDIAWLEAARKFLVDAVSNQIEQYEKLDHWGWANEILRETYCYVNENYVALPTADDMERFLSEHQGDFILLKGASGRGKSWFLKHYASEMSKDHIVAAVFNDVESGGRSFIPALEMIVEELRHSGQLDGKAVLPDSDDPVGWFEKELQKLKQDEKVIIILDSVHAQNMPDYRSTLGKSLFNVHLPSCVTMIVSAVSEHDLRECDKKASPQTYELPELKPQQGIERLYAILEKQGRRLTESVSHPQCSMAEQCLKESPELNCALAIEIFAQLCMTLRSWDDMPFSGAIRFRELVRYVLFRQERDDYKLLRSHALGYIALSNIGLTEPEIIDLLSSDEEVVTEIRSQTEKAKAIWAFNGPIPTVLWAMLYAELKPFLTEINDEGTLLLQLRHSRLREVILDELGDAKQQTLLCRMRDYDKQTDWLLYSENAILPNRRKVQECLPIYEKLHNTAELAALLRQPLCVDAFVRAGMQTEIKRYLERYGRHLLSAQMLAILRQKELLLRLWPDSFIPAAIAELRMEQGFHEDMPQKEELLRLTGNWYYIEGNPVSSDGAFFPELHGRCRFALASSGHVAVLMDGVIRIIDLQKQEILPVHCRSVGEECFLYWSGDVLIVRCASRRLYYSFRNGQLNFESEDKTPPDWSHLIKNDSRVVQAAGGWTEAEHFTFETVSQLGGRCVRYHVGDQILTQTVYEPYDYSICARTCNTLAAIVVDNKKLIVADLAQGVTLYEEEIRGMTDVEWSENGHALLVVVRGNTLRRIKVDPSKSIGQMAKPQDSYIHHQFVSNGERLAIDVGRQMHELFVSDPDVFAAADGASSDIPLFGAISRKFGWAACYFQTTTGALIRVLDTTNLTTYCIEDVQPITYQDCSSDPFYAARDCNGLVMISHGEPILFDLEKRTVTKMPAHIQRQPIEDAVSEAIRKPYAAFMSNRLHLRTGEWPCARKTPWSIFQRRKSSKCAREAMQALIPYYRLLHADVLKNGDIYWLIDKDNGMIHAFHERGACLCRDMAAGKILSADIDPQDGCLHLLLNTGQITRVSLKQRSSE